MTLAQNIIWDFFEGKVTFYRSLNDTLCVEFVQGNTIKNREVDVLAKNILDYKRMMNRL